MKEIFALKLDNILINQNYCPLICNFEEKTNLIINANQLNSEIYYKNTIYQLFSIISGNYQQQNQIYIFIFNISLSIYYYQIFISVSKVDKHIQKHIYA